MESVEYLSAPLLGQRLVDCPQQQPDGAPIVLLAVVGLAFLAALAELGLYALAGSPLILTALVAFLNHAPSE